MKIKAASIAKFILTLISLSFIHSLAIADDDTVTTNSWTSQNARFGPLDCLDHRSVYFKDSYPQPLLIEDMSMEQEGEVELDYLHTAGPDLKRSDTISAEVQKSFGVFTFELGVPYQWISDSDDSAKGVGNIELGARTPVYQYVSGNGTFDNTAGVGVDVGIPVNSAVSKNTELEPEVFDDVALGDHFTVQSVFGYDKLFGGGDDGGSAEFDYGLDFAWSIPNVEKTIPGIQRISPMFEVNGELGLNEDEAGQNALLGSAGFRMDFRPIGETESSFGLGYVFPMNNIARKQVQWGLVASFTVEF